MEVDSIIPLDWVSACLVGNQKIMEQIAEEVTTFDDRPITFQNTNYDKGSKNLRIEKVEVHNKMLLIERKLMLLCSGWNCRLM